MSNVIVPGGRKPLLPAAHPPLKRFADQNSMWQTPPCLWSPPAVCARPEWARRSLRWIPAPRLFTTLSNTLGVVGEIYIRPILNFAPLTQKPVFIVFYKIGINIA